MSPSFDVAASDYDESFTNSQIGIHQRNAVWSYLDQKLSKTQISILELNAGTGEDALWLAQKGHKVLVTDVSNKMLTLAEEKISDSSLSEKVRFQNIDLTKGIQLQPEEKFDLIFSNFAGLNCINQHDLKRVMNNCHELLNPDGELIFVFFGKFCFWESLYFLAKGDMKKASRRNTNEAVVADVNGEKVPTWYYSPFDIKALANGSFKHISTKAIGTFVPPSYLNNLFGKNSKALNFLNGFDRTIGSYSIFSNISDHYLIHLKKR